MTVLEQSLLVGGGSLLAGFLGSLTGLGGGVVLVPLLTLGFGVHLKYAVGASLVSVIATSSGAASDYVEKGYANMRIGMFLEVATTLGAVAGAYLAAHMPAAALAVLFGVVLLYSALMAVRTPPPPPSNGSSSPLGRRLRLDGTYPALEGPQPYHVHAVGGGFALMLVAGGLSGLLGIGSGALKVLAMDQVMRIPFKVSTTTSNFMIGVTAAASAGVYLQRGTIDPGLAMPVVLGVLLGALLGAKVLVRAPVRPLRVIFAVVVVALALQMIYSGFTGRF